MADDRTSFDKQPLTIGSLRTIVVVTCAVIITTSTVIHQLWPPSLSTDDRMKLEQAYTACTDTKKSIDKGVKLAMRARDELRCSMVESRAFMEAGDDYGPRDATPPMLRKEHRAAAATKAINDNVMCVALRESKNDPE